MKREKEISLDWDKALSAVEDKRDEWNKICYAICCGFTDQDLLVLTCLHEAGLHREMIEYLLEDCNFHHENSLLQEGKYDECRAEIIRELVGTPLF